MTLIEEFQKRASDAGLTEEQLATFVQENELTTKLAEPTLDDLYTALLAEAGVEKTAASVAYVEGFLKQACDSGVPGAEAVELTKAAVSSVFPGMEPPVEKQAEESGSVYFQGMLEKAADFGLSEEQTISFLQKVASPTGFMAALRALGRGFSGAGKSIGRGFSGAARAASPGTKSALRPIAAGAGAGAGAGYVAGSAAQSPKLPAGPVGGAPTPTATDPNGGMLEQLKKLLMERPELAGALTGAGAGGLAGAASGAVEDEQGETHIARNALMGGLLGVAPGAIVGRNSPDMFKNLGAQLA